MFSFKKLEVSDFSLLLKWLNSKHVKEYWDTEVYYNDKAIYDKYYPRIIKQKIDMFIIFHLNTPIGYIQTYNEDNIAKYKLTEKAYGIDLYIGNTNFLHKGYGKAIIIEFVEKYIFSNKSLNYCVIDPELSNVIAQKAYYKAGFRHVNTVYSDVESKNQYLMVLTRDSINLNFK
ncbi:MAG: GNAT family N-acetyltransferase [Candidatus Izemoplasma sp.]